MGGQALCHPQEHLLTSATHHWVGLPTVFRSALSPGWVACEWELPSCLGSQLLQSKMCVHPGLKEFDNILTGFFLLVWCLPPQSVLPEVQQLVDPGPSGGTGPSWKFCLPGGLITTVLWWAPEKWLFCIWSRFLSLRLSFFCRVLYPKWKQSTPKVKFRTIIRICTLIAFLTPSQL